MATLLLVDKLDFEKNVNHLCINNLLYFSLEQNLCIIHYTSIDDIISVMLNYLVLQEAKKCTQTLSVYQKNIKF